MEFEWDPVKSSANKRKHGIDFEEAQALWDSPTLRAETRAGNDDVRHLTVGVIGDRYWTAITTPRDDRTRIISVRRSRDYEREAYDERIDH